MHMPAHADPSRPSRGLAVQNLVLLRLALIGPSDV